MHRELTTLSPTATRRKRKSSGFTFTEVIVASTLLLVAMVPILKALTQAHLSSIIIERKTRCLTLAQTKLDDIKARSIYNWVGPGFDENNVSLDGAYLCTVRDTGAGADLKNISIEVGYDLNGNNQLDTEEIETELVTYVARRW
jgi:Tfp pilus assembly protein PilV